MKYQAPYGVSDPNAAYVNGNPSTGTMGSIPPAASIEFPQREIVNLLTDCGLTPSDADLHQVGEAIQSGALTYGVDTGAVNAMIVTLNPRPPLMVLGFKVRLKIAHTNTIVSPTLSVTPFPPAPCVSNATGNPLLPNDLVAGCYAEFEWDGTVWRSVLVSPSTIVRDALFPYIKVLDNGSTNLAVGVVTALANWGAPVGDSNLVTHFNTNNGLFTVPANYDGLWFFQSYCNQLTTEFSGQVAAQGIGFRLYRNGPGSGAADRLIAAAQSVPNLIQHGTVMAILNMVAGDNVQATCFANDSGMTVTNYTFTALRLGRST
jgi:hypothetical protein